MTPIIHHAIAGSMESPGRVAVMSTDSISDETRERSSFDNIRRGILIIFLIMLLTLVLSMALYLLLRKLNRRCLRRQSSRSAASLPSPSSSSSSSSSWRRRASPDDRSFSSLIDSLPAFSFASIRRRSSTSVAAGDCAVCLSKFEPSDQLRLLPLCCHAFHAHCIDTWLRSQQTCPLCRSSVQASESDIMKALSTAFRRSSSGTDSFRLDIGSISRRRHTLPELSAGDVIYSYSVGSFEYVVDRESEVPVSQTHRRSYSDKDIVSRVDAGAPLESSVADQVASGRSWLKDYVDRISASISSRATSFRTSGRIMTGSSRRSDFPCPCDPDLEASHAGEEISELFRWFSEV